DASMQVAMTWNITRTSIISTDPPYYDNIAYADLSDFFYVWLRRTVSDIFPDLFETVAVPKGDELVAARYRHNSKKEAEDFFVCGMTRALQNIATSSHMAFPVTVYYAFKQSESKDKEKIRTTGWETFLDAVIGAGLAITGTWPVRTEQRYRLIGRGTNALASSVVLVCRPRAADANTATRREFQNRLLSEFPDALGRVHSNGDLCQSSGTVWRPGQSVDATDR
ncbi:MAG: hypothetical protein OXG27_06125, partial [Chloroflexi bacterium]|nr:hypothetical protein [Chloroflexota bacterium]